MTIVVNGDLDLHSWHHIGYGVLVVTGVFTYDPDASWMGIVLVIGQGQVVSTLLGGGEFDGAVLVAQTRQPNGTVLPDPNLGSASWRQTVGGTGIYYSSCWINSMQPITYKVLSFREVPIPTP